MLAIQITTNVFVLAMGAVLCLLLGFLLRQRQLQKSIDRVIELEKEMLKNHAEIIDLHRQNDFLKNQQLKPGATIVKLNDVSMDDAQNGLSELGGRKKAR